MDFFRSAMDFFTSTLRRMGILPPQQPRPTSIALESSKLGKLPRELILNISHFLPPESAASFSLCCRPIYFILGTHHLKALEAENDQSDNRYKFLTLLERDLPKYILCWYCKKLHAISKSKARRHLPYNRLCRSLIDDSPCWEADWEAQSYLHKEFSGTVFQMTMKLYRQGLDYSKLLKLLSYEEHFDACWDHCKLSSALARITADGSLLIREQKILVMPKPISMPWDPYIHICPHIESISKDSFDRDGDLIQWEYCHERKKHENGRGLIQCDYCLTEFRVDFKSFGKQGVGIFITKWQNLGEGQSHLDQKWRSHLDGHNYLYKYRKDKGVVPVGLVPVEFDRGSICARFEGKNHCMFEFDRLISSWSWKTLIWTSCSFRQEV